MLRATFIGLSENQALRHFAEKSPLGLKVSRRFVAGTTVEELLQTTERLNRLGIRVSIDNLGENVTNRDEAQASANLYHQVLDEIDRRKLDVNVSLKLTHMGLDVEERLACRLVTELAEHAAQIKNFIRVDMEGSAYTQRTLDFVRELHRCPRLAGRIGTVLQAYLHRTMEDAQLLVSEGIRVRLCKGAYQEPPAIAFQAKSEVDANYLRVAKFLLKSGVFHGLATHDQTIITHMQQWTQAEGIVPSTFEFQMLHGVRRDLQERLPQEGWGMRVYVPFGTEWYPYLMRRLAERPANVWFIAKNLLRG
jgi:proline dehydrogenase